MTVARHNTHRTASRRMVIFLAAEILFTPLAIQLTSLNVGLMLGFDGAAIAYLVSCMPLFWLRNAAAVRPIAAIDGENPWMLLVIASLASTAILAAVASELVNSKLSNLEKFPIILGTILLAWTFANMAYALHYAHMHYGTGKGCDDKGLEFPGTAHPDYWDFAYFAYTMGVAFATSDVNIRSPAIRRVAIAHCFAAFIFNIGVIGFTINLLAGMHG